MDIQEIDIKHRIQLKGKYNPSIWECPYCDTNIQDVNNMVGFAEWKNAVAVVIECPKCFEYSYFHATEARYDAFKRNLITNLEEDN